MKRRTFIKSSGLAGGVGVLYPEFDFLFKRKSALDQLNVAVIGCNGMGWSNVRSLLKMEDVNLVAICDVDASVVSKRVTEYSKLRKNVPSTYSDYQELLKDPSIDAVVIGTPDHWHCKIMVDAVRAGKHVYTEKPIANTIEECNIMVDAAHKTGKIVQVGQWQRSGPHYAEAIKIVQSGVLGNIRQVKVWAYQGWMGNLKKVEDSAVPEGVDYKMWLGPAPSRPFNANRFHFNFRWYWDYAGGLMTDWGVHEIDIALFAMKASTPKSIVASGGKFAYPDDPSETPDTLQAIYEFDGFNMVWEHAAGIDTGPYQLSEGISFIGNNATLLVNRQGYKIILEHEPRGYGRSDKPKMEPIEEVIKKPEDNHLDLHMVNFIQAIKENNVGILNTPISSGSIAAIQAQMGNIAYKTQTKLHWDGKLNHFKDNKMANEMMKASYHNGYKVPQI